MSTSVGVDRLEDKQMLGKNDSRIVIAKISYIYLDTSRANCCDDIIYTSPLERVNATYNLFLELSDKLLFQFSLKILFDFSVKTTHIESYVSPLEYDQFLQKQYNGPVNSDQY